jgi:hypothetical protein
MGTRINLLDKVYTVLVADATLQTLLGGTAGDKRIYQKFPGSTVEISASTPAYIIIYHMQTLKPYLDRETMFIQVSTIALDNKTNANVTDRVDALLNNQSLSATGWTDVFVRRHGERIHFRPTEHVHERTTDYEIAVY